MKRLEYECDNVVIINVLALAKGVSPVGKGGEVREDSIQCWSYITLPHGPTKRTSARDIGASVQSSQQG